jgi:hypothetical protein
MLGRNEELIFGKLSLREAKTNRSLKRSFAPIWTSTTGPTQEERQP